MNNFNKTTIAPVVAIVCLAIGTITGHPIGNDVQAEITTVVVAVGGGAWAIWGVFKNHKKAPNQAEGGVQK